MRTHRRLVLWFVSLLIAAALVVPAAAPAPAVAQNGRLKVIASFSILADVAAQVAGDTADVRSLMPIGTNPHAYSPSAQDVADMSDADAVFVAGLNFEETLLPVVQELAGNAMFIASACVPVRPIPDANGSAVVETPMNSDLSGACSEAIKTVEDAFGTPLITGHESEFLGFEADGVCGAHADEADTGSAEHEHEPGSCDPHVWTDPVNVALWALTIRDTLSALDSANAPTYAANAATYIQQLAALNTEVQTSMEGVPTEHRTIVTNHLTFGYFAARYGLTIVGVVIPGGSTTAEPSVQDVLALVQTIQDHHVPVIFTETTVSDRLAKQIADEAGARIVRLYTDSLSDSNGPAATYLDYIRTNATTIADALK